MSRRYCGNCHLPIGPGTEHDRKPCQPGLEVCPACEGGGIVGVLYPSGHAEVKCDCCYGTGYVEAESEGSACTCGAEKCGLALHSPWCDKKQESQI